MLDDVKAVVAAVVEPRPLYISRVEYRDLFTAEMQRLIELTCSKNANYANDSDALANFRLIETLSGGLISTEIGILTRMSDKIQRLTNLICGASNNHESIEDNLDDLAVYAIILKIYVRWKARCQQASPTANGASGK